MDNEAPLRRLNGRLQACDQCRARKVACDHAQPVCNRCIQRNQAGRCTYTIGSVLQPRRRARQQKSRPINNSVFQEASPTLNNQSGRGGSGSESAVRNASANVNANANAPAKTNGSPSSGFFGFTSHAVVYEETQRSLSRLQGQGPDTRPPRPNARGRTTPRLSFSALPPIVRHMSIYALEALPGQSNEQIVFYEKDPEEKRWSQLVLARITNSVLDLLKKNPDGSGPDLERVAEILCNNSAQPLRDMDDPQQWMDQYCGDNLRWESIGLIWGNLERLTDTLNSLRPSHVAWIPGKSDRELSRTHLSYCIDLARKFTDGNSILLDLIRRQTTFISHLDGDAAASCWYSHGAAVSMLTYMGLHAQVGEIPDTPTLCSEHNRRIVAQIYNHDKFSVAFSGRPSLLNHRYCMTPLPLDLRDEDLADEATLQKAAQDLDERGWNKEGKMYPFTLIRARRMMASILEEVMELALGCTVCTTLDELRNIQVRELETFAGFPACLIYDPQDLSDPNRDIENVYAKILIRLGHLQVMFFLERLLCINGSLEQGNLLVLSFEMLTLTLTLWTHKDQFAAMRRNFEWLTITNSSKLMAHAAPAGGILCLELLNPSFTGKHPKEERITRSSIIQNLSLLVGFLDWVRPSAPNGDLCIDCKVIIQRVLDHTLNGSLNGDSPWAALAYDFPEPLDFNFELLDTFDWLHMDFQ